jgi:hypothetical protein
MPDFTNLFSSFLKADDLRDGPRTLTIASVTVEELGREDGPKEKKPVMRFREDERGLTLNKSRYESATDLFGSPDTDRWTGKQVQLVLDPTVKFGGRKVGGIVLRRPN